MHVRRHVQGFINLIIQDDTHFCVFEPRIDYKKKQKCQKNCQQIYPKERITKLYPKYEVHKENKYHFYICFLKAQLALQGSSKLKNLVFIYFVLKKIP